LPPRQTLTLKSVTNVEPFPAIKPVKIAIVGSGPDADQAPYKDDSWTIWAFSRKQFNKIPRFDLWFELHDARNFQNYELRDGLKGYSEFLKGEKIVLQKDFPKDALIERFGTWFFQTGQAAWMMAYAIMQGAQTIGLWGIDAIGPYKPQRIELQHWCQVAKALDIEIVVPEKCTLLDAAQVYGFRSPKR